jgi:hypothetical protein
VEESLHVSFQQKRTNFTEQVSNTLEYMMPLICRAGCLEDRVATHFAELAVWKLSLASYPGATSYMCKFLAQQGQLTSVDVSTTLVVLLTLLAAPHLRNPPSIDNVIQA